jgi:hypothetical protein
MITAAGNDNNPWFLYGSNESIIRLQVHESVLSIPDNAFRNFSSLREIKIPASVKWIGSVAFFGCRSSIQKISIEESSVKYIGESAFHSCSSLQSIILPDSITSMGGCLFKDCQALVTVKLPNGITSIPWGTFQYCMSLTNVQIPPSVLTIMHHAFHGCTALTEIHLSNSVTLVGNYCFCSCTSLTRILLPNSVRRIGYSAFRECSSLAVIRLPKNHNLAMGSQGRYVFDGCIGLTKINVPRIALAVWPHYLEQFNDYGLFEDMGLIQVVRKGCAFSFLRQNAPQLFEDCGGRIAVRVPGQGKKRRLQQEHEFIAP